jgi:NhaP-type Na+/H+ or K+/H+ antiporter
VISEVTSAADAGASKPAPDIVAAAVEQAGLDADRAIYFPQADLLWAAIGLVVIVSVVVHGIAATPVMQLLDRTGERSRQRTGQEGDLDAAGVSG